MATTKVARPKRAKFDSLADLLASLGGVSPERIGFDPAAGDGDREGRDPLAPRGGQAAVRAGGRHPRGEGHEHGRFVRRAAPGPVARQLRRRERRPRDAPRGRRGGEATQRVGPHPGRVVHTAGTDSPAGWCRSNLSRTWFRIWPSRFSARATRPRRSTGSSRNTFGPGCGWRGWSIPTPTRFAFTRPRSRSRNSARPMTWTVVSCCRGSASGGQTVRAATACQTGAAPAGQEERRLNTPVACISWTNMMRYPVTPTESPTASLACRRNDRVTKLTTMFHLWCAERELRAADIGRLPPHVQRARRRNLDRLRIYRRRGEFPRNTTAPYGALPCFVDADGRRCAVAHLLIRSGAGPAVAQVAETSNTARLREITSPALEVWARDSGLTRDELARIQPMYSPSMAEAERYG